MALALKAELIQFQDGQRSSCPFRKRSMPFSRHLDNFKTTNKFFSAKLKNKGNYVNNYAEKHFFMTKIKIVMDSPLETKISKIVSL